VTGWETAVLVGAAGLAASGRETAAARPVLLWFLVLLTGVYGGYFGAANGVILIAILIKFLVS
jgi:hypothetical protein